MRRFSRNIWTVAAAGIAVGLASAVAGPASAAAHKPMTHPDATGYSTEGQLYGVGAASDGNAWAVGRTESGEVLLVNWDGTSWSRVTSPSVLTDTGSLNAITVVNSDDAWAVGSTGSAASPDSLIMHWNGTAWTQVTSPTVTNGILYAVTANAKSGWAGGMVQGPTVIQTSTLVLRLTSGTWARVDRSFGKDSGVELDGVATTSTGRTFATGLYTGMITGLIARWTGSSWAWEKSFPEEGTYHWLNGIAAGQHGQAFAVGLNTGTGSRKVISIRWTGHAWVKATAPSTAELYAVAVTHGGTAWAAGSNEKGTRFVVLTLRWNGHSWKRVAGPSTTGQLNGLGFAAANYGWAVGYTALKSGNLETLILHWNGHSWS